MRRRYEISLQNRLALTYALFISLALVLLTIIINIFSGFIFTSLVKGNIAEKNAEIVSAVAGQYKPMNRMFDAAAIEAMGMYFVHEGYIVRVEDSGGGTVWDARSCDMQECASVISDISRRMENDFGVNGSMRKDLFPVQFAGYTVGTVIIETYGPFFYSETESVFLTSLNRLMFIAAIVLTLASVIISLVLARAIALPVNKSAEAARLIAQSHQESPKPAAIRIDEQYHTQELAGLARSINAMAAALEESERRQKQLTADIAHELRTPLTCLQGSVEAMMDGVYPVDREHLAGCHEEIIRLGGLVRDLHTLTSLEWDTAGLDKTEFDLAALVRITAEQFKAAAFEKGITLDLQLTQPGGPPLITACYDRLKQVFINLLANAVQYTEQGSIIISIARAAASEGWEVSIADTGMGIPPADLPHIFERFYRADKSRSRNSGGSGIGLAIAAAIVHAHGGSIMAEERPGGGSVFHVMGLSKKPN